MVPVLSILWAQSKQVSEKFSAQNKLMLAHQLEISETSFETKKMVFVSSMSMLTSIAVFLYYSANTCFLEIELIG